MRPRRWMLMHRRENTPAAKQAKHDESPALGYRFGSGQLEAAQRMASRRSGIEKVVATEDVPAEPPAAALGESPYHADLWRSWHWSRRRSSLSGSRRRRCS